ncbi:P-loop containing nucleoside triphosphate hydrolase protein [Aspergillus aurantiobrunneus]
MDQENSYFVGDAAGRMADHSDVDFHFSINIGVGFHTPEEFFLDLTGEAPGHKFEPVSFLQGHLQQWSCTANTPANGELDLLLKECRNTPIIVLVGGPGAGKSHFCDTFLHPLGYRQISLHKLGSQQDCIREMKHALNQGIPVAIDNTNSTVDSRRPWLSVAHEYKCRISAVYLDLLPDLCLHNDAFRALGGDVVNTEGRKVFPRASFLQLMENFEKPELSEGFSRVVSVGFQWMGSEEELQIWRKYWV